MSDVNITINGGNNQILPNATEAVQNFYDGKPTGDRHADDNDATLPEVDKLTIYINKVNLPGYLSQIGECETASELAMVVVRMVRQEPRLTPEEMVRERFIKLLLPFAFKLQKGRGIDNLRARINDAWAKLPREQRATD